MAEKTINAAKVEKVRSLQAKFAGAKAAVLSDYCGLNVQEMSELRGMLRQADVELHVVKNTLARLSRPTWSRWANTSKALSPSP